MLYFYIFFKQLIELFIGKLHKINYKNILLI
jgi:hypothetical protein